MTSVGWKLAGLAAAAMALLATGALADGSTGRSAPRTEVWTDVAGNRYTYAALIRHRATVFLFSSTECPLANQYTPRMIALARDYAPRGVAFYLVDSNSEDDIGTLRTYARERAYPFPVIKDRGTILADRLNAQATPEAIVVDRARGVRYLGRIDDSADPERVGRRYVRMALDSILAGRQVPVTRTLTLGCAIFRDYPHHTAGMATSVSYARDIAPILDANCVVCHRRGEVAPFPLETYQEARTWAAQLRDYTAHRLMPPWKPDPACGSFRDARCLTSGQIAAIAAWANAGAPFGDPHLVPRAPAFPPAGTWRLGTPDVVLDAGRSYHLQAEGKDVYRNFVLPIDFKEDRYVSGFEFQPGNRAVVHHIVAYIDPSGESAKLDGHEKEPGYTVPGIGIGIFESQWGDVWVPGSDPRMLPPGVAVKITRGSRIVMQVHYHKDGKTEVDRSRLALYFARAPVQQQMVTLPLGNMSFELRAGGDHEVVTGGLPPQATGGMAIPSLPFAVHVHSVFPHMHMLGRDIQAIATLPDGTQKTLIRIRDWDFNWQATYFYKEPIALPRGTKLQVVAVYDNSEKNTRQTSHPPKLVRFGEQTTDEMCFVFLGMTIDGQHLAARDPGDAGVSSTDASR